MKLFFTISITIFTIHIALSQNFQKGYYIKSNTDTVYCFINNQDWINNPADEIRIRETKDGPIINLDLSNIQAFSVGEDHTYFKYTVEIDKSSDEFENLNFSREPEYQTETIFLKSLVKGNIQLLGYKNGKIKRFYTLVENAKPTPLVYKKYLVSGTKVQTNETYKQQLYLLLQCPELSQSSFYSVGYYEKDLIKLFLKYYQCMGIEDVNDIRSKPGTNVNLYVKAGMDLAKYTATYTLPYNIDRTADYGTLARFRFGVESEFFIKKTIDQFAIIASIYYSSYKSELQTGPYYSAIDLEYIEIPIGIRFFVPAKSSKRFHVNAGVSIGYASRKSTYNPISFRELEIGNRFGTYAGLGFSSSKVNFDIIYNFPANILLKYPGWEGDLSGFTFVVGYNLL